MESLAHTRIVLLDACRTNPFIPRLVQWRNASRGLRAGEGPTVNGLASLSVDGTVVAYSTAPGFVADDGDEAHSPFTGALLKYLPEPSLEIRQVLTRVRAQVVLQTRGYQVPWESSSLTDDLYIAKRIEGKNDQKSDLNAREDYQGQDILEFDVIKSSTNVQALEAFITRYPNSSLVPSIIEKLNNLKAAKSVPKEPISLPQGTLPEVVEARVADEARRNSAGSGIVEDLRLNFASNASQLSSASMRQLDELGAALTHSALEKISRYRIAAHTDLRGSAENNIKLSQS